MFQRKPDKITSDDPPCTKVAKGFSSYVGEPHIATMSKKDCERYLLFLFRTERALDENIYHPVFSKIVEQQVAAKTQQSVATTQQAAVPGTSSASKTYKTFPKT